MIIIYILILHILFTFYVIDHNKNTAQKHVCGSQQRNGRDMTSRRRPTTRQLEVRRVRAT